MIPSISNLKSLIGHSAFRIPYSVLRITYFALLVCLTACARPDAAWGRLRDTRTLRVGMDASFPPFEAVVAGGTLAGFDVDLARELGRRLGVEVQFVANLPYDGLYDALAVGRVDAVISALVVNPARTADFAYSTPYFDAGQVLVVRTGEAGIEEIADLSGRALAVEFGTQGDMEARTWARQAPGLAVVPYQTASEALAAVTAGEAEVALVDHVSALAAAEPALRPAKGPPGPSISEVGGGLQIVGTPLIEEPYAIAVRRESRYLLRAVNDVLAEMKTDGTLEALVAAWLADG